MDNLNNCVETNVPPIVDSANSSQGNIKQIEGNAPPAELKEIRPPERPYAINTPPAAAQGWYKRLTAEKNISPEQLHAYGGTLNNAAIYSIVAHNPLQKPEEIQKPIPKPQPMFTPTPMTNPMPQRTRMFTYNPYRQMRASGMY